MRGSIGLGRGKPAPALASRAETWILARMKVLAALVVLVLVAGAAATWFDVAGGHSQAPAPAALQADAVFSPRGGCARAVAHEIASARKSARIVARAISSEPVVAALAEAHRRGVVVEAVLDGTAGVASANALYDAGVAVYLDRQHAAVTGATVVIDEELVIVSAIELSDAAETNEAGSMLIARSPVAAAKCGENWRVHLAHADPLESLPAPKTAPSSPFKTSHRP
jgi:phosphatidylserine/phosphatidylglycerophosphate/cardiolipin synthase-like enzyme